MVGYLSANSKVSSLVPGMHFVVGSWIMVRHVSCFMHLTPGTVHNFPKARDI